MASYNDRDDSDSCSTASFQEVPVRRVRYPRGPPIVKRNFSVSRKTPDLLHVLQYVDWYKVVLGYRHSDQPFTEIPDLYTDDGDGKADEEAEVPVIAIITTVQSNYGAPDDTSRPPRSPHHPQPDERPVTELFGGRIPAHCDDFTVPETTGAPVGNRVSPPVMRIHSEYLINALQAVLGYSTYVYLDDKTWTFTSPYSFLYHRRQELARYRDNQPACHSPEYAATTAEHIDLLLNFLEDNLGKEIKREEERHQLDTPMATFCYFWLLLKPGEVIYAKRYGVWSPFVISSVRVGENPADPRDTYRVNCWLIESNGTKVDRFMYRFDVNPWVGEQAIGSLPVVPAAFWVEDLDAQRGRTMREKQIEEGKLYWELLKRPTYMDYDGLLVNSGSGEGRASGPTGFMCGRVVCDAQGFDSFFYRTRRSRSPSPQRHRYARKSVPVKDTLPQNLPRCGCQECAKDRTGSTNNSPYVGFEDLDPLTDNPPDNDLFYLVCSNTIPGFLLGDRDWGHLNVAHLKPVEPDRDAFKSLVLEDDLKLTVKALMGQFAAETSGPVSPWGNDFVKNKGEGRIVLLHGKPGVGKTCTAECVAELTNRPLLSLTSGDLGVSLYNVEDSLDYFFALGQRYGALVLLDEADIYLERRRPMDISRNGLVSVFLRALEYYRGVLFLTTNRVKSFDNAFLSRIHVALHYKDLGNEDRERIWNNSFDRLDRDSKGRVRVAVAAREYIWTSSEVRSLKWNGREIRNGLQTALALAESDAQTEGTDKITILEKHLRAVVKMSRGFKDYIRRPVPYESRDDYDVPRDNYNDGDFSDSASEYEYPRVAQRPLVRRAR